MPKIRVRPTERRNRSIPYWRPFSAWLRNPDSSGTIAAGQRSGRGPLTHPASDEEPRSGGRGHARSGSSGRQGAARAGISHVGDSVDHHVVEPAGHLPYLPDVDEGLDDVLGLG